MHVDLNADVGEGTGEDAALMTVVTSVNVACGGHAGDTDTMRHTVTLARAHGVAVGAHPAFADREHFGRREMRLPPHAVECLVVEQVSALAVIASAAGVRLQHVKPHGALYNLSARDVLLADAIARGTASVDSSLVLLGLAGSELLEAGRRAGLRTASEAFADRGYRADGTLVPRSEQGSVIEEAEAVARRATVLVREGHVIAVNGARVPLRADSLCVHGDTPGAALLARRIRAALEAAGVRLAPFGGQHPS